MSEVSICSKSDLSILDVLGELCFMWLPWSQLGPNHNFYECVRHIVDWGQVIK